VQNSSFQAIVIDAAAGDQGGFTDVEVNIYHRRLPFARPVKTFVRDSAIYGRDCSCQTLLPPGRTDHRLISESTIEKYIVKPSNRILRV
jgi:hypothetical protein